jgi:hypothetical protein
MENGQQFTLPLSSFSAADQAYIKQAATSKPAAAQAEARRTREIVCRSQ